jgi:hypothetical protein
MQQAALVQAMSRFSAQRASAAREATQRYRDATEGKRTENAWVMLGIGGLFLGFAVVCFVLAISAFVAAATASDSPAPTARKSRPRDTATSGASAALGIGGFGAFWTALGGGLFYIGIRYRRAGARERTLRTNGIAGRAIITSWRQTNIVVDGKPRVELVLQVEVPGQPPRSVKQADYVPRMDCVSTGAEVPIFVNRKKPDDVLVDWWSA